MQYMITEKADARVIESSLAPYPFPGPIEMLPVTAGVILLAGDLDMVVYVAWGDSIRALAERAAGLSAATPATRLRWFRTADDKQARAMGKSLIRKYKPKGNEDDSQWGVAPV